LAKSRLDTEFAYFLTQFSERGKEYMELFQFSDFRDSVQGYKPNRHASSCALRVLQQCCDRVPENVVQVQLGFRVQPQTVLIGFTQHRIVLVWRCVNEKYPRIQITSFHSDYLDPDLNGLCSSAFSKLCAPEVRTNKSVSEDSAWEEQRHRGSQTAYSLRTSCELFSAPFQAHVCDARCGRAVWPVCGNSTTCWFRFEPDLSLFYLHHLFG
jgi:hypothetical protein